jgi:hypothetical protein
MHNQLIREVRILRIYTGSLTVALLLLIAFSFTHKNGNPRFEEIDVERINIIEKDGKLKMVISNRQRQHPGMINGKEMPARQREAGMIFFNAEGDECGGLVYDGNSQEAGMTYSVDQFRNDQIMQLNYTQKKEGEKTKRAYGLKLWDRREDMTLERLSHIIDSLKALQNKEVYEKTVDQMVERGDLGKERFFAGKNYDGEVGLFIRDAKGKPRIKLYVDKSNNPRLQFLDENGKVVPVK